MAKLYDPTAAPTQNATPLAGRVADLNGKVIGMLDISKPNGNYFLDRIAERIQTVSAQADYPDYETDVHPASPGGGAQRTGAAVRYRH